MNDLSWRERMARFDEIQASAERELLDAARRRPVRAWAPWQIVLTVFGAAAACFAAGAVLMKVLGV